jgi:hypothetical protein
VSGLDDCEIDGERIWKKENCNSHLQPLHTLMSTLQEVSEFVAQDGNVAPMDEELDLEEQQQQTTFDISEIGQAIKVASEGALTVKTMTTYRR